MSDRLKFFRRLMSAFEATSNPQRAVERGFYVNLPNNPIEEITGRVALRPSSVHLLFGGIGSGKTTQLLLAQQALNELEDIKAIYVDVSLVADISDLQSGALIAIAGLELIKILGDTNNPDLDASKQVIQKVAYGYNETIEKYVPHPLETIKKLDLSKVTGERKRIVVNHKGLIYPQKNDDAKPILQAFLTLSKAARLLVQKEIIFLFDGLDRLSQSKTFIDAALNDVIEIRKAEIGSVLVGSIVTPYTQRESISSIVGYSYFLPYFDVFENVEAQQFFTEIFKVRDPEYFITPDARILLMYKSGGVLRDLMSLCQAAIEEAYMDGLDQIKEKHVNQAVLAVARSKIIGLTDLSVDILRKVVTEKSFSPRASEDFELLLTGHILEYRYPRPRYVVHPILAPLVESIAVSEVNG
ncbi:hypothetical protein [Pseudanabaena sp. BC1403]|uniref:hypothetical protein n=1 Tax=Pseudanabaena sp. BC1403 TaxID=2043171 RepID=UPI0011AF6446|nr:hypothetical protein [Pseudanabaena sp. BC1403]